MPNNMPPPPKLNEAAAAALLELIEAAYARVQAEAVRDDSVHAA